MTTKATPSNEPVGRLLDWLGLRHSRGSPPAGRHAPPDGGGTRDLAQLARHQLIGTIMAFLVDNDLDVSPANLLLAHAAFSGKNPHLARQITTRSQSPEGISQQWLSELAEQDSGQPDRADLDRLMTRLETNLESFHAHAKEARSVTSDYGTELEQLQKTGRIVSSLADIAKVMLERTRKAETDMRKSEDEAKALRRSLERAKRDAEVDFLTGLPNRRAFDAALARAYEEARAACEPLSVAFCDIDEFKKVNDLHGHEAGDRVINTIADTLARARHYGRRAVDAIGRAVPRPDPDRSGRKARRSARSAGRAAPDQPQDRRTLWPDHLLGRGRRRLWLWRNARRAESRRRCALQSESRRPQSH